MSIVVRSVALVVGWAAYTGLLSLVADGEGGANIGAGLLGFALVLLAAASWAFLDGRRNGLGWVSKVWVVVGAVLALFVPLMVAVTDGTFDASVVLSDLLTVAPFILLLVTVPAVVAGAIGSQLRAP